MPPKPIFIIGAHRSGTTWLSNLLAAVPGIYAPTHTEHRGVHESAFFSHLLKYCNFGKSRSDLLAMKYLFEKSDFFLLTGLDGGPDIIEHGYAGYFRLVMDAAAERNRAAYWLEKTPAHTLFARFIKQAFPDAVLIAVKRDYKDVVRSKLYGFGNPGSMWQWFRQSMATAIYEKVIESNGVFTVRYADLDADLEKTARLCLAEIGMNTTTRLDIDYPKNTSFETSSPRIEWWQNAALLAGRFLVLMWPASTVEKLILKLQARSRGQLPNWFFLIQAKK